MSNGSLSEPSGHVGRVPRPGARARSAGSTTPRWPTVVIAHYPKIEPELRPQAVELLSQRESWARPLVDAVQKGVIPPGDLNVNQIRKLLARQGRRPSSAE